MSKKFAQLFVVQAITVLAMLAGLSNDAYAKNNNAQVIPPHASLRGHTYSEWEAKWWQAAFAIPVKKGDHPILSGGAFEGEDGVMFLAVVGGPKTLDIEIPAGTPLFVPVINAECSVIEPPPFHGEDETSLRACAHGLIDNTHDRSAEVDGGPVRNLDSYRVESPLYEFGPLPANNLLAFFGLDAPEGTTSPSVDAGYYLLIRPLSVGKHELHIRATSDDFGTFDTTFKITVLPIKP